MTLDDLVTYSRYQLGDYQEPHLFLDVEMVRYAQNAMNIFCRDALILEDSYTESICTIHTEEDVLDYSLSNKIINVTSAKLLSSELMTLDVVASPTAWAADATLTGATSGSTCNVVEALTTTTYTVDERTGEFKSSEVISDGTNSADQGSGYPVFTDNSSTPNILTKYTSQEMNSRYQGWRSETSNEPTRFVLDYRDGYITFSPPPDGVYTIALSVIRYPTTTFSKDDMDTQTIEIPIQYHDDLVNGICYQACLKIGENTYRPQESSVYRALFQKAVSDAKRHSIGYSYATMTSGAHKGFI